MPRYRFAKTCPLRIQTRAFFENGVHSDPENVHKGIVDALFYNPDKKRRGSDKHTGGQFEPPLYDKANPRVEFTIYPPEGDLFSMQGGQA